MIINHKGPSVGKNENGGNHPPKNKIDPKKDIAIICKYSPKKNRANHIDEYSLLKPDTNSLSLSGRSKGGLKVSASADTKNMIAAGNNGKIFQTCAWFSTIFDKFKDPVTIITNSIIKPIDTS